MSVRSAFLPLLTILVALAAPAATAQVGGITVTTPTITIPTPTTPTLTTPTVSVPTPAAPALPSATVTSPAPTPAPSTSDVGGAVGAVTGAGSGGSGADRAHERSRDVRRTPTPKDPELRASRKKFKNRRERGEPYGTTLSFWLDRPGTVRLFIRMEAPVCDPIGVVAIRGEAGVNRYRFLGRWRGEPLPPGTYSVTGVVVRGERARSIGTVRLVIVGRDEETEDARAQRSRCGAAAAEEAEDAVAALAAARKASAAARERPRGEGVAGTTVSSASGPYEVLGQGPPDAGGAGGAVLRNPFGSAPPWLQALLLGALAIAIALLAAAAVPARAIHPTGAAVFVADRRMQLALAGAVVLGTVAIAALLV